jgi:hypothetical protein
MNKARLDGFLNVLIFKAQLIITSFKTFSLYVVQTVGRKKTFKDQNFNLADIKFLTMQSVFFVRTET